MTRREKVSFLAGTHSTLYYATQRAVFEEMSARQSLFCVCGRLATGLHEDGCGRLQNKVVAETIRRLKYLFPKGTR